MENLNILFADEDVDKLDAYVEYLEDIRHHHVTVVYDPESFFSQFERGTWHIVILDIMYPRGTRYTREESMDGRRTGVLILEDIKKVGETHKNYNIPVVIRTAVTGNEDLQNTCLKLGVPKECYFEKPGNLFHFVNIIEKYAGEYQIRRATKDEKER